MSESIIGAILIGIVNIGISFLLNRSGRTGRERIQDDITEIKEDTKQALSDHTKILVSVARIEERMHDHDRRIAVLERAREAA